MSERGVNARELAMRAGVGSSFVYDILKGKSLNPTTKKLAAIAEVLGVPLTQFVSAKETGAGARGTVVSVPLVDTRATAETGVLRTRPFAGDTPHFEERWLAETAKAAHADLRLLVVDNHVAVPDASFREGDMLLLNVASAEKQRRAGLFLLKNKAGLRLLERKKAEKESGLSVLGRVVWFSRSLP